MSRLSHPPAGGVGRKKPAGLRTVPLVPLVPQTKGKHPPPHHAKPPLASPAGGGVSPQNINENRWDIVGHWDRGAGAPFRPLWSWQKVPDGAVLPPGLEIKTDLLTSEKWARL